MFSEAYEKQYEAMKNSVLKGVFSCTGDELKNSVLKYFRSGETKPNDTIAEQFQVDKFEVEGCNCFQYVNKNATKTILFIHGGGFFIDIMDMHWNYAAVLCKEANAEIYLPQYPLIPENNCEPCFKMLLTLYKQLLNKVNSEDLILMGDSAGGGIALAFAMLIREHQLPQPKEIILISPCLKLSTVSESQKDIAKQLEAVDPMISYICMDDVRAMWGGCREKGDYLVEPFYGDLKGLAQITMFSGTADILYLYNQEFYDRMKEKGYDIEFHIRKGLMHDYVILPVDESEEDRKIILDKILR